MSAYTIQADYQFNEKDAEAISKGIGEFNSPHFGHQKTKSFLISLKDENQMVVGGLIAWMRPGIRLLFIDIIWIAESLRHCGYGTKLMQAAEEEGIKNGCDHSQLETLSFQAKEFYEKLGYIQIGHIKKYYGEHDAYYMRKKLIPE